MIILSSVHSLGAAQLAPFCESLTASGYTGRRIMLCYDENDERELYLASHGWACIRAQRLNGIHPAVQRFADFRQILAQIETPDRVLLVDARDSVFQGNPGQCWTPGDRVTIAPEGILHKDDEWAVGVCKENFPECWDMLQDSPSYCAGVIAGPADLIGDLCTMIFRLSVKHTPSDQAALNVLANQPLTSKAFGVDEDMACHCGTMLADKFESVRDYTPIIDGSLVLPNYGEPPYLIVHQYDRIPDLPAKLIPKYVRPPESEPAKTGAYAPGLEIPEAQPGKFRDLIKGRTVALVGPADCLQNGREAIGGAEVVVRLNRGFPVSEPDREGTQTDILYHCLCEEYRCGGEVPWEALKTCGVFLASPYPRGVNPFHADVCRATAQNIKHGLPFHTIDRDLYLALAVATGTRPNSGICAIVDLLAHRPKSLTVYGFDFFETGWRKSYKVDPRLPEYMASEFDGNHHQAPQRQLVGDLMEAHPLVLQNVQDQTSR